MVGSLILIPNARRAWVRAAEGLLQQSKPTMFLLVKCLPPRRLVFTHGFNRVRRLPRLGRSQGHRGQQNPHRTVLSRVRVY